MIYINLERWADCRKDIELLTQDNFEEVEWYKDKMPLDPDWGIYERLDDAGIVYAFMARDCRDAPVGYSIYFVLPSMHSKGTLMANNDILYVKPEYRKEGVPLEMLNYAEVALKSVGVQIITQKMKTTHTFHGLMERTGYEQHEYVMTKWVGE